jgi:hypothetical protein
MSRLIAVLAKLSFLAAAVAALALGPAQAAAAASLRACGGESVGSCPPLTPETCREACLAMYPENGGVNNECFNGCCICAE